MTEKEPTGRLERGSLPGRANDIRSLLLSMFQNERLIVSIALCVLVLFSTLDFFEDRAAGASSGALFSDVSDLFLPLVLLMYIWRVKPQFLQQKTKKLRADLAASNSDLQHWKTRAAVYLNGLAETINQQFDNWQLSRAEKEIAMLLLKGFSLKDMAELRGTSERTVRQQAVRVYDKAGLRGRAELSAFFLEDLMLPPAPSETQ